MFISNSKGFIGVALALSLILGCSNPTVSTTTPNSIISTANQVSATVSGIILDGNGSPVSGVEVVYSDGSNPSVNLNAGRTIQKSAGTNEAGHFELQFLNETNDSNGTATGSAGTYVTIQKAGYTSLRVQVDVPTISQIRTAYAANLKAEKTITILSTNGSASPVTVSTDDNFNGFHAFLDLSTQKIFRLDAELTGTMLLKKKATDPDAGSVIPPVGSLVQFILPADYSPRVYQAVTDATGKFIFSPTAGAATFPVNQANPLPVFSSSSNSATSAITSGFTPFFTIQPMGPVMGVADSGWGAQSYEVSFLNFTTIAKSTDTTVARSTDVGTLYAIADNKVKLVSWTPVTTINDVKNYFDPITAAAPTPLTFTFSKPVNIANLKPTFATTIYPNAKYNLLPHTVSSADGLTVTITPSVTFLMNDTISVTLTGLVAQDGSSFDSGTGSAIDTLKFYTKKGIVPLSASWLDAYSQVKSNIGLADDFVVTFSAPVAGFDASKTKIVKVTKGASDVATSVTASNYYEIETLGSTVFTDYGASSNTVGTVFKATLAGAGTGTVLPLTIGTTIPSTISITGSALTLNPGSDLVSDAYYYLTWDVSTGVVGEPSLTDSYFGNKLIHPPVSGNITLLSSNVLTNDEAVVTNFAVASAINLVFDTPVQDTLKDGTTPYTLTLTEVASANVVPSVVSLSADRLTLTLTPSASLDFATVYNIDYTVYNGVKTSIDQSATLTNFKTVKGGTLTAPTLGKDNLRKANASNRTTYNFNETALYVSVTNKAALANADAIAFESRITELGKTAPVTWTAAASTLDRQDATNLYYNVTAPAWKSGDTVEIRAKATSTGKYYNSVSSAVLSFTDQVAPTTVAGTGLITAALVNNPEQNMLYSLNSAVNTSSTDLAVKTYTFTIDSNITLPTVTVGSALNGLTYDVTIDPATPTVATITLYIDKATVQDPMTIITAGNFVTGEQYRIKTVGTTDYTLIGATTNSIGELFTASGPGAGTGTATWINPVITAGSFVTGTQYLITTLGTTDYTLIGAPNNNIGTRFNALGAGAGTGTATQTTTKAVDPSGSLIVSISDAAGNVVDFYDVTGAQDNLTINF